jgi:predicted DNA binding protein
LRVEWTREYGGILSTLIESEIPLIKAVGTNQEWAFDVRADDRSDLAAFQQRCREEDISITLTKLHALTPLETETEAALTEAQQEALVLAYDRGYFESPREVTMEELGEELGISQQAIASRLRRGIKYILGSTIPATGVQTDS